MSPEAETQSIPIQEPQTPAEPITPASLAEPADPETPQERVNMTEAQQRQAERLKRDREIARIEKVAGRGLSEEEKKLVLLRFEESVQGIDKRSQDILERYSNLTKSGGFKEKVKGFFSGLAKSVLISGGTFVFRQAIKATPLSFMAGTISGSIIGGILGGKRSYEAEATKRFSAGAIKEEYQKLKEDDSRSALAFLQSVLEGRGDKSDVVGTRLVDSNLRGPLQWARTESVRKARRLAETFINPEQGYRGDLSGLLELITFYQKEARETLGSQEGQNIDETILNNLGNDGRGFRENYRDDVRKACQAAIWGGVKKGALVGAGVGAVSDIVSWFGNSLRSENAHKGYILSEKSDESTYRGRFQDTPPDWLDNAEQQFDYVEQHFYDQGLTRETDFGNSLADTMYNSLEDDRLELPNSLQEQFVAWKEAGKPPEDFFKTIAGHFRFATPRPEHAYFYQDQNLEFNYRAMQEILNRAYENVDIEKEIYPENFFNTIKNADQILSVELPENIAREATQAATQAATNEPLATSMAHAGVVGLGTKARVESGIKGSGGGGGGIGSGGTEGGGAGDGGEPGEDEEIPSQDGQDDGVEGVGDEGEQQEQQTEATPENPPSPDINWEGYVDDLDGLKGKANEVIEQLKEDTWESTGEDRQASIVTLFKFLLDKASSGEDFDPAEISLGDNEGFLLKAIDTENKRIGLQKPEGEGTGQIKTVDLTRSDEISGLKITKIERREEQ